MKKIILFLLITCFFSCAEKLMEKPDNLISKERMVEILNDLAIINAAKSTNAKLLQDYDLEPTKYIFEKYDIDSLQFVESDRYYASIPEEHEEIYIAVEAKLEVEKERLQTAKKIKDSLTAARKKEFRRKKKLKDSLLKNNDK
ncbi:DUF4296 domain-containing protein [Maribacter sp. 2308TA10-17]|uniref:DUF4296 domain-containing protein n=1 Tax=Maribacter sp. 2308TA10-17 TaxID=3386276 RepID=UPI0039BCF360